MHSTVLAPFTARDGENLALYEWPLDDWATEMRPVEGLVMSSPALNAGLSDFQKLLLAVMPKLAPNLCAGNGLDARYLSHDPEVVQNYLADRLVHDKISPRMGKFIADAGPATV